MSDARSPLHVLERGAGEPELVFLHHFAGSGRAWTAVIEAIGPGRRCLAVDLRGFGGSQGDEPRPVAEAAQEVLDVLRSAEVGRFVLVGHSMGGKIAWAVAQARPAGLLGVVLVGPSPPTPEPIVDADRQELLDGFGRRDASEKLADKNSVRPLSTAARDIFVDDSKRTSGAAWRHWVLHGSREDISAASWPTGLPALVITGLDDTAITSETVRREVVDRIPGARLETIADAGHLLPYEIPSELAAMIVEFSAAAANGA